MSKPCKIEGCEGESKPRTRLCGTHHWQRQKDNGPRCTIDGCEKVRVSRGLCLMHLQRLKRTGDVGAVESVMRGRGEGNLTTHGYIALTLHGHDLADKRGRVYEHRAVLYAEIGPGNHDCHWCGKPVSWLAERGDHNALQADHLDADGLNNHPDNLVPSCRPCNEQRLINRSRGTSRPNARLTEVQVLAIYAASGSQTEIARSFGVSRSAVSAIKNGYSWSWLTERRRKGCA